MTDKQREQLYITLVEQINPFCDGKTTVGEILLILWQVGQYIIDRSKQNWLSRN
jgi:hypothetical protein